MISRRALICLGATLTVAGLTPAAAQTGFRSYECADGSQFVLAFYRFDSEAHLQIDGKSIALKKRLAVSGARYSARDIALRVSKAGAVTIKHGKRPVAACSEVK